MSAILCPICLTNFSNGRPCRDCARGLDHIEPSGEWGAYLLLNARRETFRHNMTLFSDLSYEALAAENRAPSDQGGEAYLVVDAGSRQASYDVLSALEAAGSPEGAVTVLYEQRTYEDLAARSPMSEGQLRQTARSLVTLKLYEWSTSEEKRVMDEQTEEGALALRRQGLSLAQAVPTLEARFGARTMRHWERQWKAAGEVLRAEEKRKTQTKAANRTNEARRLERRRQKEAELKAARKARRRRVTA